MGRKRKSNKNLPQRVYHKHGAYYLVTLENKWIRLGSTKSEMYKTLSEIDIKPSGGYTIESLWNDFNQDPIKVKQDIQYGFQFPMVRSFNGNDDFLNFLVQDYLGNFINPA